MPSAPLLWRRRKILASIVCLLIIVSTAALSLRLDWLPALSLLILSIFRIGNMARILKGRMHEQYLKRAVWRTSITLFIITLFVMLVVVLPFALFPRTALQILMVLQVLVAAGAAAITAKNILKLQFKMPKVFLTDRELPTVTVAIPARNETDELQNCLQSLLANDYPKLEVIVLDDCSQARTADIIKSFAHNGVRFVPGAEPAKRWLAKNQAYQKLYEEATGELILFCGADVRFGPHAIRSMVNLMHARDKSMLSVLPIRFVQSPASVLIQPSRYWWELSLPRRLFNRPAVLSTCWMIGRQDMKQLGGFSAVSHSILPERFFARELVKTDQYSFVRSSNELEVLATKNFHEQYATAIRTRYPQLRRRPEWTLLLAVFNFIFLMLPFVLVISRHWLPLICICLLVLTHVMIVSVTDPGNSLLAIFTFPIALTAELVISFVSMVRYEFLTVAWKDRNICIPVMHVIPKLPELKP